LKHLKVILENLENVKVLDTATGGGGFLSILSSYVQKPAQCVGVDQSAKAIEFAKQKHAESTFTFEVMESENLLFEDEAFDIVGISNSLHHLSDVKKALSEMVRVLKPGGFLVVYEMISDNQSERQMTHVLLHHFWAEIDSRLGISHNETYTQESLFQLLEKVEGVTVYDRWVSEEGAEAEADTELTEEDYSFIENSITNYIDRAKDFEDIKTFEDKAAKLKDRLATVGFQSAKEWMVVLQKN
jgi:ubiquinone/menaquinone biosynthesis C-methylase UbiE